MRISFIGIGKVGSALARRLTELGHDVVVAARDMNSAAVLTALGLNPALRATPVAEAVNEAEVVFLATPFEANELALKNAGPLAGKILVDCTNPVTAGVAHAMPRGMSGGEYVQNLVPEARVVKAFTIYGYENLGHAPLPCGGDKRPVMPIAGNRPGAKRTVAGLCEQMGWEPLDVGDISMSLHLEHMTLLWIKMVRVNKLCENLLWCASMPKKQ